MDRYNFKIVEEKWQKFWNQNKTFSTKVDKNKKKFYCLEMFPYPSGKIHMGHVRNYTIGDVLARYKTLQNYNVLHPMGWDSFGMPAENAARQNKLDPKTWTEKNISVMKTQLKKLGLSIDWDKEISTCSPDYYRHQQEFFLELYDKGLVYRKESYVNWDPVDNTVLANEQVIDGKGWRSGAVVERKKLNQWFFKITKFSKELLESLDTLKNWPNKVKVMQKNWIGKSYGCEIKFKIKSNKQIREIECYTTRPDTLFGMSFLAVSIDHPIAKFFEKNSDFIQTCLKFALTRLSPPTLALIAADKALNCNENYIKGAINEYSNRRKVLISELSKLSNIKYSDPIGAFYSIIKLPIKDAEKFSKFLLTDFSINNESVMLAPASGFYSSKNNGDDEVRIAFVLNSEKLKRAINIIDKGLKEYIS